MEEKFAAICAGIRVRVRASSYSYAPTRISDTQVPTVEGYLARWLSGVDNDQELTDSD